MYRHTKLTYLNIYFIVFVLFINACTKLPINLNKPYTKAFNDTSKTTLNKKLKPLLKKHKGKSGFHLLHDNLDAFSSRILLIDAANKSIDAQYYAVEDQLTGKLFLKHLLDAANRGVRIRLLIDDLKTDGRDAMFAALDTHPNMSIKAFNPFSFRTFPSLNFLTEFKRLDRRMHNKSFNVDNIVTILGGRNIGDKYFSASTSLEFKDLDIMIVSTKISNQVSNIFDEYWNDSYAYPFSKLHQHKADDPSLKDVNKALERYSQKNDNSIYATHARKSNILKQLKSKQLKFIWAKGNVYADSVKQAHMPRKEHRYSMAPKILTFANKSQKSILIISPYFVPKHWGKNVFSDWIKRGIKVRIVTNSLASNDVYATHAGYVKYRKQLLRLGVEIYELKSNRSSDEGGIKSNVSGLHAKSFIFDEKNIFIGSMNLDTRSIELNSDMGVLIKSTVLSKNMLYWINKNLTKMTYKVVLKHHRGFDKLIWIDYTSSNTKYYDTEPNVGFFKRMTIDVLKILPIKDEL